MIPVGQHINKLFLFLYATVDGSFLTTSFKRKYEPFQSSNATFVIF